MPLNTVYYVCKVTAKSQNSKCFIFKNHKIPISAVVVNHKIPNCDEKYIMAGSSQGFVNEETYFNRTGRINSANGFCY